MHDMYSLAIIWIGVFLSYLLAKRTRLTPVLYFLAFGCLMVNLDVLPRESSEFVRGFSEIGIILIMFALGFEEDPGHFVNGIKRSWGIALFGALAPFATAYYLTYYFWQDVNLSLLCGLAMTATAVSLTMVSLRGENLHNSDAATGIMTSAILDDIASLAAVAILIPLATGAAEFSLLGVAVVLFKALLFFLIITVLELFIFPHQSNLQVFDYLPWLRRFGVRDLIYFSGREQVTLAVLLIALLISLLSFEFGFHPAVGAYMAGLIIKRQYFSHASSEGHTQFQQTREIIDNVAFSWIGPVFFVELGTRIIFDADIFVSIIPFVAILSIALFLAQISSAALAARYTGSFNWQESLLIGLGMLGRAELALVVMDIGYVQHNILTDAAFYTLMATAFVLNIAVPVSIKFWKRYFQAVVSVRTN